MAFILIFIYSFLLPMEQIQTEIEFMHDEVVIDSIDRNELSLLFTNEPLYDVATISELMDQLNKHVYKEPTNATIREDGTIIDGKQGVRLDQTKLLTQLLATYYDKQQTTIEVPKQKIFPRVTSELLADIREQEIGRYETYYKASNKDRSHNVLLSTKAINNYVVFPGEQFSFNDIVGRRTVEKGYRKAKVIVKGEFAEDIGGGICQVSSTLFNAVDINGIDIIERHSHSRSVPYVPSGRDATVSWLGPDFVFKNELTHPILIQASAEKGINKVIIYTADEAKSKQ